jgi:hypothetical protein
MFCVVIVARSRSDRSVTRGERKISSAVIGVLSVTDGSIGRESYNNIMRHTRDPLVPPPTLGY